MFSHPSGSPCSPSAGQGVFLWRTERPGRFPLVRGTTKCWPCKSNSVRLRSRAPRRALEQIRQWPPPPQTGRDQPQWSQSLGVHKLLERRRARLLVASLSLRKCCHGRADGRSRPAQVVVRLPRTCGRGREGTDEGREDAQGPSHRRPARSRSNTQAVQKLLGHSSISTTGDIYTDWDIDQLAETLRSILEESER